MIGIDAQISILQTLFNNKLFTSVADNTYNAYHRAFLNEREERGTVPEILYSGDDEYSEVLLDDTIDGLSFFIVENDYNALDSNNLSTNVSIYFAVNLKVLYPTVTEHAMEYLHRDVMKLLKMSKFDLISITTDRDAFSDFNIKVGDNMQPFYLVKFTTTVDWNINQC